MTLPDIALGGGAATPVVLLSSADGGVTWDPIFDPVTAIGGGLTDTELRASPVPILGIVALDAGTITALTTGGGLTDAQLRAMAVDVTGEVALDAPTILALTTGGGLTDLQLRASAVVVDTELGLTAAVADGTANPTITRIQAYPLIFNGTSWDRVRTQSATPDGTLMAAAVGVPTDMPLMSDGTAVQRFMTMPATDNIARQEYLAVGLGLFDGATYDRATGDAANGLDVDVTRMPAVALDAASLAALETTELGAATLAALETISLDATSLAALETTELGATTLAALESITAVDGGGSLTVDAVDLDIRNLDVTTDDVGVGDASGVAATLAATTAAGTERGLVVRVIDADKVASGTVTLAADTVEVTNPNGFATANIHWTQASSASTYVIEGSHNGTNWFQLPVLYSSTTSPWAVFQYTQLVTLATGEFSALADISGWERLRVRKTAGTLVDTFRFRLSRQPAFLATATAVQTKGARTEGGNQVQQIRDTGRNNRVFMLDTYTAAPLVEALVSVVQWYGNAAVAATTTPAVIPTGKTLRLTHWSMQYTSLAAAQHAMVRVRFNTGGVVALGSPLVYGFSVGQVAAVAGLTDTAEGTFPEGFEFPAGGGIGFTMAGYSATGTLVLAGGVRFRVHGYEF